MHQYLRDTEFAVSNLLRLANEEENQLKALAKELGAVEAKLKVHKWDFESSDLNEDFSDMYLMGAFARMAKAATELKELQHEAASLQASIGSHQQAIQAIAGAVFQVAKQGISLVYGKTALDAAPDGRFIGMVSLKSIIWQARNQAMHFEEGKFLPPLLALFATLEAEHGPQFSLATHAKQCRAKQVLDLLGWNNFSDYLQDMSLLLPP